MIKSVSVALCTFNGERFLQQQLDSLAAQSILPDELIICDDASSDNTIGIAEKFSLNSKFKTRIIKNPINLGYVKNFEKAISLCNENIIFLCDQDDVWARDKIQQVVSIFNSESTVGLVFHGYKKIDSLGFNYHDAEELFGYDKLSSTQLAEEVLNNSINVFLVPKPRAWCGCMMAFRHDFKDVIVPIFPGKGHDDWILKVVAPLSEVRFISSPLIEYRIHEGNSNNFEVKKKTYIIHLHRLLKRFKRIFNGYSKKNFYRMLIERVVKSKHELRHPELIEIYRKFSRSYF